MLMRIKAHYDVSVSLNGVIVARRRAKNLVPTQMVNHLLDVVYGGATPVDPWYIGLINNTPAPAGHVNDTLASHAGWVELTSYSGNRKAWVDAAATGRAKATSTPASFTMSSDATIYGLFLASAETGTTGVLGSVSAFDTPLPVVNTAVVNVIYKIELE